MTTQQPRTLEQRRLAAIDHIEGNSMLWLTTGSDGHGAHLIPVAYHRDGTRLIMATFRRSRTAANLRANPRARVAIGELLDLVMIDGDVALIEPGDLDQASADAYARVSLDPRTMPGLVYFALTPVRMQVWNGFHEFQDRTVMDAGQFLGTRSDEPAGLPE